MIDHVIHLNIYSRDSECIYFPALEVMPALINPSSLLKYYIMDFDGYIISSIYH